jgi:hypothetical protein
MVGGRIVGGEVWQEKVHHGEERKKLLENSKDPTHCAYDNGTNE